MDENDQCVNEYNVPWELEGAKLQLCKVVG